MFRFLRGAVRATLAAGLVALAVGGYAATAWGHDQLIATVPADGEQLTQPPAQVRLEFTAEVLTLGTTVLVTDSTGRQVTPRSNSVQGTTVVVDLPELPPDDYRVAWRVVSTDGHPISGSFAFTVGQAGSPSPATPQPPTPQPSITDPDPAQSAGAGRSVRGPAALAVSGVVIVGLLLLVRRHRRRRNPHEGIHP